MKFVFQRYDPPLYFVTFNVRQRHKLVANDTAHFALIVLGKWIPGLKRVVAAAVTGGRSIWQRGLFNHVIRKGESYSEKWEYIRQNQPGLPPVTAAATTAGITAVDGADEVES